MIPVEWQETIDQLLVPIAWIPPLQQRVYEFFMQPGAAAAAGLVLLLLPALLALSGIWCSQLALYTLPFRSHRITFCTALLLAWWDAARAVWLYWVGLVRVVAVSIGWLFALVRFGVRFVGEVLRQIIVAPFALTGRMTQSYFQPGVPWVAFLMLVFWCLLEAVIFTYTLHPTVSEVLADLVAAEPSPFTGTVLYLFLFILIMGSFACLQAMIDAVKSRQFQFIIQMILVELFVMAFEVMFLYRELVDAITPWIAQQTDDHLRLGIGFTLSIATFGWIGIRGMTWFLFGQYGTQPLLAFISRRPMVAPDAVTPPVAAEPVGWRGPVQELKGEIAWLHDKSHELLEFLALPVMHLLGASLNFGMILLTGKPAFKLPFRSLNDVLDLRPPAPAAHAQPQKVMS